MNQSEALSILKTGANVFLTGEPGSGKTYTVNKYIEYLRDHGIKPAVTASTGIAATHLGGMTIHSWSGIGIKNNLTKKDLSKLKTNKKLVSRANKTDVLIIDEISMLDAKVLTAVDLSLRALRENQRPFGGLQIVLVGDFFQLPPIARYGEPPAQFAFESESWTEANPVACYLTEQHRQEDTDFLSILKQIRSGKKDTGVNIALFQRIDKIEKDNTLPRLYAHNIDVDLINNERLRTIDGKEKSFNMHEHGPEPLVQQLKKGCLSPEVLTLKIGAQVMFTKNNFESGYVNGTLGEVVGFNLDDEPIVKTKNGDEIAVSPMDWNIDDGEKILATITQLPLRLSWAITIHKSQGMTLDAAIIDLRNAFAYGQGYVAISRVRSLSGLFLLGYNERALEVHPDILTADIKFKEMSQEMLNTLTNIVDSDLLHEHKKFVLEHGGSMNENIKNKALDKSYSVNSIREKHKNAYKSWSQEEDETLMKNYSAGSKIQELAILFGRQLGSIRSRIAKLKI